MKRDPVDAQSMTADAEDRALVFVEPKSAGEQATGTPVGREVPKQAQLEVGSIELVEIDSHQVECDRKMSQPTTRRSACATRIRWSGPLKPPTRPTGERRTRHDDKTCFGADPRSAAPADRAEQPVPRGASGSPELSVADHRIKRSAAEILTSTRQIVDALRLTGTRTEDGEDVGLAKRTEVVATMRDRRCGGVLSMA